MVSIPRRLLLAVTCASALAACGQQTKVTPAKSPETSPKSSSPTPTTTATSATDGRPERIWIRPDDYHVPYAGTAEDGRRFFLSEELFDWSDKNSANTSSPSRVSYTATFWWKAGGAFDEVTVDKLPSDENLPPGQAGPAPAGAAVLRRHIAALGHYTLEPIRVEPFLQKFDGIDFGWRYSVFEGLPSINIEPGNFIAYYAPWDGYEYDT